MLITSRPGQDRRYDNPTTTEVAAVYVGEGDAPPNPSQRDFIIYDRTLRETQNISATSEHADPMMYLLLFFHAEFGWHPDLLFNIAFFHYTLDQRQQQQQQQNENLHQRPN